MFRSELSAAGGTTVLRNSDKKKLVSRLSTQYAESGVEALFRSKDAQYKSGAVLSAKGKVPLILRDADPLFFEYVPEGSTKSVLAPTVYALWECPKILKPVVVHQSLMPVLWKGAKLMVPGVMRGLEPGTFKRGELRALYASDDMEHALGVGVILCTTQDVQKRSGHAMQMLHLYKDFLWSFGSKSLLPETHHTTEDDDGDDEEEEGAAEEKKTEELAEKQPENDPEKHDDKSDEAKPEETAQEGSTPASSDAGKENESSTAPSTEAETQENTQEQTSGEGAAQEREKADAKEGHVEDSAPAKTPQEMMDELVTSTLYRALKTRIGKDDLPMLASTFYSVHMLPCRPAGSVIDIKKSSFKKLSKLLSAAEAEGVLTIEIDKPDIVKILSVNKSHPLLRAVDTSVVSEASLAESAEGDGDDGAANMPLITEFYEVNDLTRFVFEEGTTAVTHQQAVSALMKYIKEKGLDAELGPNAKKSDTCIDDAIGRATKLNPLAGTYSKRDVLDKFVARMKPFYVINRDDLAVGQRRVWGTVPNIVLATERRASNKKVTTISGLQAFRIDLNEAAEELQVICAAAASVQKSKHGNGLCVIVGGTAHKHVVQLLTEKYRVPKKYIVVKQ